MKKKVYVVTSGEYSGYHIDAVFLSRKAAEDWLAPINANMEARRLLGQHIYGERMEIEEWEVGAEPKKLRAVWTVEFDREGNVVCANLNDLDHEPGPVYEWEFDKFPWRNGSHIQCTVEAKNQETAVKIAQEQRMHYLASKAGMA